MEKLQSDLSELRKLGEDTSASIKLLHENLARLDQILDEMERRRAAQTSTTTTPTSPSDRIVTMVSEPANDADGSDAAATSIKETWIGTGHGEDHGPAAARVTSVPPLAATTKAPASPSVPVASAAASDALGDLPLVSPTTCSTYCGDVPLLASAAESAFSMTLQSNFITGAPTTCLSGCQGLEMALPSTTTTSTDVLRPPGKPPDSWGVLEVSDSQKYDDCLATGIFVGDLFVVRSPWPPPVQNSSPGVHSKLQSRTVLLITSKTKPVGVQFQLCYLCDEAMNYNASSCACLKCLALPWDPGDEATKWNWRPDELLWYQAIHNSIRSACQFPIDRPDPLWPWDTGDHTECFHVHARLSAIHALFSLVEAQWVSHSIILLDVQSEHCALQSPCCRPNGNLLHEAPCLLLDPHGHNALLLCRTRCWHVLFSLILIPYIRTTLTSTNLLSSWRVKVVALMTWNLGEQLLSFHQTPWDPGGARLEQHLSAAVQNLYMELAIELQISDFSDHTTLVWFSCTISRSHLRAMVRNPELKFLSTGPTPEAFVSCTIHGATYGSLADWHLQNQIIWTRAPTASITEWILTPWDPGQELVLSDFTKVSCSQVVHDTYLKELMLQNLNVSTSKKLKFQSIYFDHTLLTTHKPRPAAQGMCTKLPICESPDGPCCCVLSGLHFHSTISLAGSGSLEWGCHQAVFCRVLSELLLHLGWTCYTTRHQSGHETLYSKQVWELAMDTYLRGHLREKNSVTWLFVVWTRLNISSCISIVLLLSSYGPNGIGYRLLGSTQVDIAFWPEYVLIRSNEMPATRKFPHAHYLAGLPIITSPTFQNAVNCSLANCKVCRRNQFVILIHISALPRPEFSGLISGRTLAPSFVSSQILMTVQIGWLPSFPAYFVTNELSNEDNSDCCFSCWYRGEPALFLFWAFDRHAVFQGRRCAMISIICCLVYQSIDNLVYLHSNGLKVLQVTGDPGVCNVPSSVGTQEVQLRIPWDPGGYYGLKILKSHGEAVDDPWGQGSQKEGVMSCTRPCWSTKIRFSGYSALVGPACKGVEGEKGYISQYRVPTQGVDGYLI